MSQLLTGYSGLPRFRRAAATTLLALLVCACGCGGGGTSTNSGGGATTANPGVGIADVAARGGELVVSARTEPRTFNRLTSREATTDFVSSLMHAKLPPDAVTSAEARR